MMAQASTHPIGLLAGVVAIVLWSATSTVAADPDSVGTFTAVQGKVLMQHSKVPTAVTVKQNDDVFFRAVIETQRASRTKALFLDDTLLTVGENSRVEITEQIYDPSRDLRSVVARLVAGKVRALVGRVFEGAGSKFEVHTPTAVAAARGTYFVVWIEGEKRTSIGREKMIGEVRPVSLAGELLTQAEGPISGAANIGQTGVVAFTSGGQTVNILPGQFSIALPNQPPLNPSSLVSTAPGVRGAISAIETTEVKDEPKPETPKEILQATGDARLLPGPPLVFGLGRPGGPPVPGSQAPVTPVTPPAVVSGAAGTSSPVTLTIQLP